MNEPPKFRNLSVVKPTDSPSQKERSITALELLLDGLTDEAKLREINRAFYDFAKGDPNGFGVQFAVLLQAHCLAMKDFPERAEELMKALTKKLSALMLSYQTTLKESVVEVKQHTNLATAQVESIKTAVRDDLRQHRAATDRQITELRQEIARLAGAAITFERHAGRLAEMTDNRIAWGLGLAFVSGGLLVTVIPWILRSLFH